MPVLENQLKRVVSNEGPGIMAIGPGAIVISNPVTRSLRPGAFNFHFKIAGLMMKVFDILQAFFPGGSNLLRAQLFHFRRTHGSHVENHLGGKNSFDSRPILAVGADK